VATSATFLQFPSLAPALHTRLLLPESCGAIDVGGACVGLIHALATAKGLLRESAGQVALVVASEVHSRCLDWPQVPGEFRGLFGDGACALVLGRPDPSSGEAPLRLGRAIWGCSGTFASSLRLTLEDRNELKVRFDGKQLASAAISQMERVLQSLERHSGKSRSEVDSFALHQPNPRIVEILAQKAKIELVKIPLVSNTCGNLGSATCGVSLCQALTQLNKRPNSSRTPLIFLAAVGPGLIWGGSFLH
jgi:3-oxoacyl-[acyl-carrier-protein] synthase-3